MGESQEIKGQAGAKSAIAQREEEILKFWQEKQIFQKSLDKDSPKGEFTFYDGPPFATGLPHYGHLLPGTIKDVIPRYKTMQGFHVSRRWGWDCHGLPVENLIEKELGLKNKREIENYGIEKFNKAARDIVLRYNNEWKKIIPRTGRWVDMDNYYTTMDSTYTESVWWSFKKLFEKDLVYEGYRVMPYCSHCGTTLSNFEVNQGYKDIADLSAYVKFELVKEPGTFFVAWTTTPWTLPGNFALAVKPDTDYVTIASEGQRLILAKSRLAVVKTEYSIEEEFKGSTLVGKSYKLVFDYYKNAELKNKENAWKVWAADFVTTEDGTGIVHIAPAFGDDDLNLAEKNDIPFLHHVDTEGKFKKEVTDFAGQSAKPIEDPQKADIEVIKYLAHKGLLFAKEKITHSYPHCWRCGTPLLNYATSSWFIKVTALKDKLVAENNKVKWVPQEIGENRFGNWLTGAKDWGVSRQRYWGSAMPIWRCVECKKIEVLGSIEELSAKIKSSNTFIFMRHGEAEHNIKNITSSRIEDAYHLTEKGREEARKSGAELAKENIDHIIVSPFMRTRETADIVAEAIGSKEKIIIDPRLGEFQFGDLSGHPLQEYYDFISTGTDTIHHRMPNGESVADLKKRMGDFLADMDTRYSGATILVITHEGPAKFASAAAQGIAEKALEHAWQKVFLQPGQYRKVAFAALPRNEKYELDLHRPYIDGVTWKCECGGEMKRILDVFDTWYDSGSMPYASVHYPFEKKETGGFLSKIKNMLGGDSESLAYPADFIAEGLDQTRGWFYTLLVLGTGLFDKAPYKNVIVNGLVLAEDGKKMSKSLNNYPPLMPTLDKYGADAFRYFLMSSPAVKAEDVRFSEKAIDEVVKKLILRLQNVYSFYALYADGTIAAKAGTKNILDRWIVARLAESGSMITAALDTYEIDKAARPLEQFIDDLSTWYLRRSRDRFKGDDVSDKNDALSTLRYIFLELSKLMAPFMPFAADDLYQKAKENDGKESVHLEEWPMNLGVQDEDLVDDMAKLRKTVELALALRAKAGMKVRQPLALVRVKDSALGHNKELQKILTEELNVKKVAFDLDLALDVELDTTLTPELVEEGRVRDIIRAIQEGRKNAGLTPGEKARVEIAANAKDVALIDLHRQDIYVMCAVAEITFTEAVGEYDDLPLLVLHKI